MSGSQQGHRPTPHLFASLRVLLVDSAPEDRVRARRAVESQMPGVGFIEVKDCDDFQRHLERGDFDVVITEYLLGWCDGLEVLRTVTRAWPDVPVIMYTASGSESVCAEGLRCGLHDYLVKDRDVGSHLVLSLHGARDLIDARRAVRQRSLSLEESEHRFRTMADSAPVLIWLAAPNRSRTWVNRAWLDFTGRPLQQELGLGWTAGIHPDDRPTCLEEYRRAFRDLRSFRVEYRLSRADGEYRWMLDSATPRLEGGRLAGFVGSVIDITERRAAEQAREELLVSEHRAREQAESALRLRDEFLSTLSAKLRDPLTTIIELVDALSFLDPESATFKRGLQALDQQARVHAELMDDLLDMSEIVSGNLRLEPRPCDPVLIVKQALASFETATTARGITLRHHVDRSVGSILADPSRMTQIVWNLLSNAIRFTPTGGSVDVALTRQNEALEIAVRDTGAGIAPELLPFVFDRFRQGDESSGLGLGLSIAKYLSEAHGGSIRADSPGPGRGATFSVRIPVIQTMSETVKR